MTSPRRKVDRVLTDFRIEGDGVVPLVGITFGDGTGHGWSQILSIGWPSKEGMDAFQSNAQRALLGKEFEKLEDLNPIVESLFEGLNFRKRAMS